MCRGLFLFLCLALAGCGHDDSLSERVAGLEERLDELESTREAERQELLERVDQIAVTQDNAGEITEIRGKLAQTGITEAEFLYLKSRVEALERRIADWTGVVSLIQRAVYAVLHGVFLENDDIEITFVGTGFAFDTHRLITNAHIVDALLQLDQSVREFRRRFGANLETEWIVVQNLTTVLRYKSNYFFLAEFGRHPQWDPQDLTSPDVGILRTSEGWMFRRAQLASANEAFAVRVGIPVATLGFPGELQGGELNDLFPIATFKDGTVSALRPPHPGQPFSLREAYIVQHNLDLSGGTSGSPIFDLSGKVIAVNNAGIENLVVTIGGDPARVTQAALGFGIRADKIQELLSQVATAKPVAAGSGGDHWRRMEGRDLESLEICPEGTDLMERLERRLAVPN